MAEASNEIVGGTIVYKARFDVPKSQEAKFDAMTKRGTQMDNFYKSMDRGGGAMAAGLGGIASLASGGSAVSSILGAFSAIGGAIIDLLAMPLIPLLMPVMRDMIGVVKDLAAARNEPGGIWGGVGKAFGHLFDSLKPKLVAAWNWTMDNVISPGFKALFHQCAGILVTIFGGWLIVKALPMFMRATAGGAGGLGLGGSLAGFGSSLALGLGTTAVGIGMGYALGGGTGATVGGAITGAISGLVVGSRFGTWGAGIGLVAGGLLGLLGGWQVGGH